MQILPPLVHHEKSKQSRGATIIKSPDLEGKAL